MTIKPIYTQSGISIYHAKVEEWARAYDGPLFHALLCDPPYHLTEMTRRYGKPGSKPSGYGKDGAFQRASRGFMNQSWDGGDVAFRPDTWAALTAHLYPGAFGMAFAASRNFHRLAFALEGLTGIPVSDLKSMADMLTLAIDTKNWLLVAAVEEQLRSYTLLSESIQAAGLIIHPMIGWLYGSGLNKVTRIDTQIDRRLGAAQRVVGTRKHAPKFNAKKHGYREKDNGFNSRDRESFDVTEPGSDLAADWAGHRYSIQALKPALEPIIVFQKPYDGKPVENMMATGAGALNIRGSMVGNESITVNRWQDGAKPFGGNAGHPYAAHQQQGRWPANVVLTHSAECGEDCMPDCPTDMIRSQAGEVDCFFEQSDWSLEIEEQIAAGDPVRYQAKPAEKEKNAGLNGYEQTTVDDGRKTPIDNPYLRGKTQRTNTHPTLKPIALSKYLATLLLPPERYAPRRLLIPFSGAGSEVIGAMLAGWEEITGIEMTDSYIDLARDRITYYVNQYQQQALALPVEEAPVEPVLPLIVPEQLTLLEGD